MAATAFEKTNLGWQSRQFFQRLSEWWELQTSQWPDLRPNLPTTSLPAWLQDLLLILTRVVVWCLLAWVLLLLGLRLYRRLQLYLQVRQGKAVTAIQRGKQSPAITTTAGWLRQVQQFQQQQNYREACRALYMALLQRLDEARLIRLQAGRTDGEYLELLQALPEVQACQVLITTHEQLCFSNTEISVATFQRCQQAYRTVEAQIQPKSSA